MGFRAMSYTIAVVVLLAASTCHAQRAAVNRLVKHKYTNAAILCSQIPGPGACVGRPKYTKVPYFPGTLFLYTFCGGRGFERRAITVSPTNLTFWAPSHYLKPNALNIVYVFNTATLIIQTYNEATAPSNAPISSYPYAGDVTTSRWQLSALFDDGQEDSNPAGLYAAAYRQTAIQALGYILRYLTPFAKPNMQRTCGGDEPYSPKVTTLVAYLARAQTMLQNYKPPTP